MSAEAIERAKRGVVLVFTGAGTGSGVILAEQGEDRLVMTTAGLAKSVEAKSVEGPGVLFPGQDSLIFGARVERCEEGLCLLRVHAPHVKTWPLSARRSETLIAGEPLFAVGFPQGLATSMASGPAQPVFTAGRFRLFDRAHSRLEVELAVPAADDGGAIVDGQGRVIGIVAGHPDQPRTIFAVASEMSAKAASTSWLAWDDGPRALAPEAPLAAAALELAQGSIATIEGVPAAIFAAPASKMLAVVPSSQGFSVGFKETIKLPAGKELPLTRALFYGEALGLEVYEVDDPQ